MRRKSRVDANQSDIVATLRLLGCSVVSLAPIGKGCPDIAVAINGQTFLVEIKNDDKYWSMTPDQKEFHLSWKAQIPILESVDDTHRFVESVRKNKLVEWFCEKFKS